MIGSLDMRRRMNLLAIRDHQLNVLAIISIAMIHAETENRVYTDTALLQDGLVIIGVISFNLKDNIIQEVVLAAVAAVIIIGRIIQEKILLVQVAIHAQTVIVQHAHHQHVKVITGFIIVVVLLDLVMSQMTELCGVVVILPTSIVLMAAAQEVLVRVANP
jgi:hypothetical protein